MNNLVEIKDNKISINEETINKMRELEKVRLEAEMMMKEIKEEILEKMEEKGFQESFETNGLKVTYKKASTRSSIDTKKLKEEEPSVYEKYLKESPVKSSISLEFLW